ncbi:glutathione S-transferase [Copidosoma floridanum]|uniref:glutathione S-transferase n=1 Tax=Copidosoma floridanum TaxID=29053 RepID=UPI0006C9B4E5|nr:glutathione S-transferase [Copidosoma floridanum]
MPDYKLWYFNITGLGEPIRFLMSYAGLDFKDHRLSFEEWPQHKSKMPMEQMPILEIDGKVYHQTKAICRYLAKQCKLYSSDDLEALEIDGSIDDIDDMRIHCMRFFREDDATYKAKLKAAALEKMPFYLGKFEERVNKNGGFFVGSKMTYADIYFTPVIDLLTHFLEHDYLKDYPALKKLHDTVSAHPKIKAYLDKRPKTAF